MIRTLIGHKGFTMSIYKNIFVNDPPPFDTFINDIPADGLHKYVSPLLGIPYLSKYEGTKKELQQNVKYQGTIIGNLSRIFVSIPTARKGSQQYYYVHYLLDTSSPRTTLTHQALCCLYGKKADDRKVKFPGLMVNLVAGKTIETRLSNPDPTETDGAPNYRNANVLGMNFLREFKVFNIRGDFNNRKVFLQLI